jgi:hypothetical protein
MNLVRLSSLTTHGRMCAALRMMQIPHVMFHTSAKTLLRLTSGIVTSLSVTQAITMPLHATHLQTMQMPAFSPLYTLVAVFSVSFQLAVLVVVLDTVVSHNAQTYAATVMPRRRTRPCTGWVNGQLRVVGQALECAARVDAVLDRRQRLDHIDFVGSIHLQVHGHILARVLVGAPAVYHGHADARG